MSFEKLPSNSEKLLSQLVTADNPSDVLCNLYKNGTAKSQDELRGIMHELCKNGYINVLWADGLPYYVTINNKARTYGECLKEYFTEKESQASYTVNDNSIHVGNGNTIKHSAVASKIDKAGRIAGADTDTNFLKRHPVLTEVLVGIIVAFVMMFAFWEKIVTWIEGVF